MPLGAFKAALMGTAGAAGGYGYSTGGQFENDGVNVNIIDKFPFASDSNATDIADLTVARRFCSGNQSSVSGYTGGGYASSPSDVIDKFAFASDGDATDVGDLIDAETYGAGASSNENGYTFGGYLGAGVVTDIIQKFSFSSDGNASDIADLSGDRLLNAGISAP